MLLHDPVCLRLCQPVSAHEDLLGLFDKLLLLAGTLGQLHLMQLAEHVDGADERLACGR